MSEPDSIIYRLKGDKVIWIIVFLLSLISIAAVYSSSSSLAFKEGKSTLVFLFKQMQFVLIGLTILYIFYKIPLRWYRLGAYFGMVASIVLLFITAITGKNINEAVRFINIFGISFQPAELAKIATVLYLAKVLEDFKFETFKEFSIWVLAPVGLVCILIFNGSASTGIFLAGISFLILSIAGVKWSHLIKVMGIALAAFMLLVLLNKAFGFFPRVETMISRSINYISHKDMESNITPEEKQAQLDKTFQADMAKVAIASVGVFGKGPGNSTQRYVLPHPYSDFIYTIIIEEWGLLGGMAVLMLYLFFLFRCIALAKSCTKIFSSMLVIGLSLLITFQALLHILVNVGLIPVTGHTLPLISLGGTSLVIMSGAFGIILSVSRTIDVGKEGARDKKEMEDKNLEVVEL